MSAEVKDSVIREFRSTINQHNLENLGNIPDYVLAAYLWEGLLAASALVAAQNHAVHSTRSEFSPGEPLEVKTPSGTWTVHEGGRLDKR